MQDLLSLGDQLALQYSRDLLKYTLGSLGPINLMIVTALVMPDYRIGQRIVRTETLSHRLFRIILAGEKDSVVEIADAGDFRRLIQRIVNPVTYRALLAGRDPADYDIGWNVQMEHDGSGIATAATSTWSRNLACSTVRG